MKTADYLIERVLREGNHAKSAIHDALLSSNAEVSKACQDMLAKLTREMASKGYRVQFYKQGENGEWSWDLRGGDEVVLVGWHGKSKRDPYMMFHEVLWVPSRGRSESLYTPPKINDLMDRFISGFTKKDASYYIKDILPNFAKAVSTADVAWANRMP